MRLAAIRDALDRAGVTATQTLEVEAEWQTIIADIVTDSPPGLKAWLPQRYRPPEVPDVVSDDVIDAELVDDDVYLGDEVEVSSAEIYDYRTRTRIRQAAAMRTHAKTGQHRPVDGGAVVLWATLGGLRSAASAQGC